MFISKRSKVVSDAPQYESKEKTDSGYVWHYSPEHLSLRNKEKKKKLTLLEKNIDKLRKQYKKDLSSDDLRERAESAIVALIDDTCVRVGNEESVKEFGTYGATTLKVKHVTFKGSKCVFKFVGKDQVKQDIETSNPKIQKVIKELIKGKKDDDFIFEIDGTKIWDRAINRYLKPFNISAKDLRGFQANRLMKETLKKKDWKEALEEVADIVGHEPATLKNQYLDPALVEKYLSKKKAELSIRSKLTTEDLQLVQRLGPFGAMQGKPPIKQNETDIGKETLERKSLNILNNVKTNELILNAWKTLQHFLPYSAKLTSGFRTPEDQKRILRNFWQKAGLTPNDPGYGDYQYAMPQTLKQLGYIVGPPQTKSQYAHLKGNAMDVSGANLNQIVRAVQKVSSIPELETVLKPQIEEQNNCVHISIISSKYDPQAIARVMQKEPQTRIAHISRRASELEVKDSKNPHGVGTEMGFGKDDSPGDFFEKDRMFINREEVPDYEIHEITEAEASLLIKNDPSAFFYRGIHKKYPKLEAEALKNLIETNAKFYFIFKYHEREEEEIKILLERAAELLSQQDVRAFFYYQIHHKFPELGRGAIIQLIDTNPDSYYELGLQKDYPNFEGSALAARNIKDPNKVELEQPEWIKNEPDKPISVRDKSAALKDDYDDNIINAPAFDRAGEILKTLSGKIEITDDDIFGRIDAGELPGGNKIYIEWSLLWDRDWAHEAEGKRNYVALANLVRKIDGGYVERSSILNISDKDPVRLAKELKREIEDPELTKQLLNDIIGNMREDIKQKEHIRSLNNEKSELVKNADELKITPSADEQKIFDLLLAVKKHYKLPVELRVAGGWVRDKLLEAGIKK